MANNILKLCNNTIRHFRNVLRDNNSKYISIGVKGGGCNGLKYYVKPTSDPPNKLDEQLKIDDVNIIVCGKSLIHILGTKIEWKTDYMSSGIEFINPNATASCGCGETFTSSI